MTTNSNTLETLIRAWVSATQHSGLPYGAAARHVARTTMSSWDALNKSLTATSGATP